MNLNGGNLNLIFLPSNLNGNDLLPNPSERSPLPRVCAHARVRINECMRKYVYIYVFVCVWVCYIYIHTRAHARAHTKHIKT